MRRTWNTSLSPTIGMGTAGPANIAFGPACAAGGALCGGAPASASAPPATMLRRSIVSMGIFLSELFVVGACLDRPAAARNPALDLVSGNHHRSVSNDFN